MQWVSTGDFVNYHRTISGFDVPPPSSLWLEWRFRSNHPLGTIEFGSDGQMSIRYAEIAETINMYGDSAISMSGDDFITDLALDEFHTYRFESLDGYLYRISVDGEVFLEDNGRQIILSSQIQMRGQGGDTNRPDPVINAWDFVRYGTVSFGEQIIAADPPAGVLDATAFPNLDRFVVTFDSPNYAYIDDIIVETAGDDVPVVIATRRLDNGDPEVLEIVLDRPMPMGETTRFTFDDGTAVNVVEYTLALPDGDNDGVPDEDDNCPNHANPNQADCDNDGTGDACTIAECSGELSCSDCNGNAVPDGCDIAAGGTSNDCNGNSIPDECDTESGFSLDCDFNEVPDECQADADGDGTIDPCDECPQEFVNDQDGDGVCFPQDQCPTDPNKLTAGQCGCGVSDTDSDDDTVLDCFDLCPTDSNKTTPGQCGCGVSDADSDADTVPDCLDQCPNADDRIDADDNGVPDCVERPIVPTTSTWGLGVLAAALAVVAFRTFRPRTSPVAPPHFRTDNVR